MHEYLIDIVASFRIYGKFRLVSTLGKLSVTDICQLLDQPAHGLLTCKPCFRNIYTTRKELSPSASDIDGKVVEGCRA